MLDIGTLTIGKNLTEVGEYPFSKVVEVYNRSSLNIVTNSDSAEEGSIRIDALNVYSDTAGAKKTAESEGFIFYEDEYENYLVGYSGDASELTLPTSYKGGNYSIYKEAFSGNDKLTKLVIAGGIDRIESYAFGYCTNLKKVVISGEVPAIDSYAFESCENLEYSEYDNAYYLGNDENPYLLLYKPKDEEITSCKIHDDTLVFSNDAFKYCDNLVNVEIGNSVTKISEYAFSGCEGLTSIIIPDSVTEIGEYAFRNCENLESVVIGNGVTKISEGMFRGCRALTNIVMGDNVTMIGEAAFENCTGITSIVIGDGITELGESIFKGCTNLESVVIGNGVTKISDSMFRGCRALTNVTIGDSVTEIGSNAFYQCVALTSFVIGENINMVGSRAFYGSGLQVVALCGSNTYINNSFEGCVNLSRVIIGEGVSWINESAFKNSRPLQLLYDGTEWQWDELVSNLDSYDWLAESTVYFYCEGHPDAPGNYWCYDENGEVYAYYTYWD